MMHGMNWHGPERSVNMGRTFEQEFTEAVRRIDGNNSHVLTEIDRVHREAARDRHHAFGSVEIAKPDPWRHRTGLTI